MSAPDPKVIVQEVASIYPTIYCAYAAFALLAYDWFLCLVQEVRLIWSWHSGVNSTSLVYVLSRYAWLVQTLLTIATNYPMSNESCAANGWAQVIADVLGTATFGAFSALRAYVLSSKNIWLTTMIILLALPPTAMRVLGGVDRTFQVLPRPFNCTFSNSPPATVLLSKREIQLVLRVSQLAAELLVVSITWRHTYHWQLYNVRKDSGIKYGASIGSFLIYNGSIYFLFLATVYLIDIVFCTAPVSYAALSIGGLLESFYDAITSVLACRFILSLRQFDTIITSVTYSGLDSQIREHRASAVLQFATQPGKTLPAFIASFAHPTHIDSLMSEAHFSATVDDGLEWQDADTMAPPGPETLSCPEGLSVERPSDLERSAAV